MSRNYPMNSVCLLNEAIERGLISNGERVNLVTPYGAIEGNLLVEDGFLNVTVGDKKVFLTERHIEGFWYYPFGRVINYQLMNGSEYIQF